jgi:hypothetical protein
VDEEYYSIRYPFNRLNSFSENPHFLNLCSAAISGFESESARGENSGERGRVGVNEGAVAFKVVAVNSSEPFDEIVEVVGR